MSVSLEKSSFVYNGQSITPVVYVAYNHNYLIQNTDFTATYSNNNAPGVATVKLKELVIIAAVSQKLMLFYL